MKTDQANARCAICRFAVTAMLLSVSVAYCDDAKPAGWPSIAEDAPVRFIRLKHGGKGWDDGMGKSNADANFLQHFEKVTGIKARKKGERIEAKSLPTFPADAFPPFLYVTGNDTLGEFSSKDVKNVREYCLKGGMLFADAGSPTFHASFILWIKQTFPKEKMVDIPDDEPIYQTPNAFPNGAPSFWHHGGKRPMGIKRDGRWVVFYHPGDMNDAWKSETHAVVSPEMRKAAMDLGVNLLHYSFTQWAEAVKKIKKK